MDPLGQNLPLPDSGAILSEKVVDPVRIIPSKPAISPLDDLYKPKNIKNDVLVADQTPPEPVPEIAGSARFAINPQGVDKSELPNVSPRNIPPTTPALVSIPDMPHPVTLADSVPARVPAVPTPPSMPPSSLNPMHTDAIPLEEHVPFHLPPEVHQPATPAVVPVNLPVSTQMPNVPPPPNLPPVIPPAGTPPPEVMYPNAGQTPSTQRAPRAKKMVLAIMFAVLGLFVIASVAFAGVYRLAPSFFFSVVPPSISKYISIAWPLHTTFDDMVPADTFVFGSMVINPNSPEIKKLDTLLERIPGVSGHTGEIAGSLDSAVKDAIGVDFTTEIKPIIGDRLYASVLSGEGSAAVVALPITNASKASELFKGLKAGKSTIHVEGPKVINGVEVYSIVTPSIPSTLTPAVNALRQAIVPQVAKATTVDLCATGSFCGTSTVAKTSTSAISLAVLDRFLVVTESESTMKSMITQDHSRKSSLAKNTSYQSIKNSFDHSLGGAYVDMQSLTANNKLKGLHSLYDGITGAVYTMAASDTGIELHYSTSFDPNRLDPDAKSIFTASDTPATYLTSLPSSTAFVSGGSQLQHNLAALAKIAPNDAETIDDSVQKALGKKLSDLAHALSGGYAISFQPDAGSSLVFQADVSDPTSARAFMDALKSYISKSAASAVTINDITLQSETGSEITINGLDSSIQSLVRPVLLVTPKQLIIASNQPGASSALTMWTDSLDKDERVKADQAIVGANSSSFTHLNSKRFYNGVVGAIRTATSNADLSQSNQEKVIDAILDVFPSISAATHGGANSMSSSVIIPVVSLTTDKKTKVEKLIQTDSSNIFNLGPFLNPLGAASLTTTTSPATTNDSKRKSDVATILKGVITGSSDDQDFSRYKTKGVEKLDPKTGVMKQLIDDQELRADGVQDPDWPNYYYTLENDGKIATVTALTETKYNYPDANGCEPKQIRGRWTYCLTQN